MSRQTRLILLLSGIALVALIALSVMAHRYSSLLKSESGPGVVEFATLLDP